MEYKSLKLSAAKDYWKKALFILVLFVTVFNYYGIYWHYWFLKGFDISIVPPSWLLPLGLLCVIALTKIPGGDLSEQLKGTGIIHIPLACYIVFGLVSMLVKGWGYHHAIVNAMNLYYGPLTIYVLIFMSLQKNDDLKKILGILFFVGLLFCSYQIFIHYVIGYESCKFSVIKLKHIFSNHSTTVIYQIDVYPDENGRNMRLSFPGLGCTPFAIVLSPLVLFGFYSAVTNTGYRRLFFYAASAFIFFNIVNTASRAPFVALCIGILIFLWHMRKRFVHVIIILLIVASIGFSNPYLNKRLSCFLGGRQYVNYVDLLEKEHDSLSLQSTIQNTRNVPGNEHLDQLTESIMSLRENLFWGTNTPTDDHNKIAEVTSNNGIFTGLSLSSYILLLIITARKTFLRHRRYNPAVNNMGILFFLFSLIAALNLANRTYDDFYWIIFGLTAAWIRNSAAEQTDT